MRDETIPIPGLAAPATIAVDRWGIPHLRAETEADLFLVQGFNAARDRLWQLDLWRKRGLGLLAADFGSGYLAQDAAARLFLFRGDMAAEWAFYAPDARAICESFVRGINAYVALTRREPVRLPPEFALFGTRPEPWAAADVVRIRSHALARNALSEVLRVQVTARADARTDLLRRSLDPFTVPALGEGIAAADVPPEVLDLFKLATASVTFEPSRLAATLAEVELWSKVTDLGEVVRRSAAEGSNNWVVAGARTESGRPILASDPHRAHALPSLRYLVHLSAPGLDVIGAGEPVVPGVSLGHNGTTAFGLTIHGADQEDVYVYETKEGDPDRVRYGEGWRPIERVPERFAVRGHADQIRTLSFGPHGPILFEDPGRRRAVALRSVWWEPGTAPYLGSLSAMRADSVAAFAATLDRWGAPSVNHVAADTSGTIGWFTAGLTPRRPNWSGLTPVPGDGRFEWAGFIPAADLARAVDPPAGFLQTANELNLPADWPHDRLPVGREWADPSRAERIVAVLAADLRHGLDASCRLQTDTLSLPAARLARLVARFAGRAVNLLAGWNGDLAATSAAAALCEVWWTLHLKPALLDRLSGDPTLRPLLLPGDVTTLLEALERPDGRFGPDPVSARDVLLSDTLEAAFADLGRRLGPDPVAWRWGDLHHGAFDHPASPLRPPGDGIGWNVPPSPLGGSGSTVMNAGYRGSDFRCTTGASVRLVIDVGGWDASLCINAPGQSGDPASPHYADLAPLWAAGRYVPLLYGRAAVDAATASAITLVPSH